MILKHNAQIRQGQILLFCHVDNLRVSSFLIETARKHIEGLISMDEVHKMIDEHYAQKRKQSKPD